MRNTIFICLIWSLLICFPSLISFALEDKQESEDTKIINDDELTETDESDITTKIYRSTDPAAKLLENKFTIKDSLEEDILNKEDLLHKSKRHKSKFSQRKKHENEPAGTIRSNLFFPWMVLFIMVIILAAIFKLLKQKKL